MCAAANSSETFSGFEESMTKRPIYTDQHHSEFAFHRFSLLRQKKILTDAVILSSDNKRFNVHSVIMSGACDYFFNNILNANDSNNKMCRLNIDSAVLEMIITFCYSGAIELSVDNVESILTGAKELQVESLVLVCNDMLEDLLDMNNCIRLLEIADRNDLESLRTLALDVILGEMPQIDKLPEFYHMNGSQMLWLIELLSNNENGVFGTLLNTIYAAENAFSALKGDVFNADMQSAFRTAFIVGFFEGEKYRSSQTNLSLPSQIQSDSDTDTGRSTPTSSSEKSSTSSSLSTTSSSSSSTEHETEPETEEEPPRPPHILSLMQGNTIQFNMLHHMGKMWKRSSTQIELTHTIESFRDAVMLPVNNEIVIFYMKNGSVAQAQRLAIESATIENITMPDDIGRANLALFCPSNDTIYCFARTNQQVFHSFNTNSNEWSTGQIDDVMDARSIVGVKNELYFIGCGFKRTMVRSYNVDNKVWTERGNLKYDDEKKDGSRDGFFNAIALDESIYVVMSCYTDHAEKFYDGTEFTVQRYDNIVDDWVIIKRINYSRFINYFNLEVAENCLYLFYGEGETHIYNEEQDEWRKGPSIDCNDVLHGVMCMVAGKSKSNE